ncbi:hypothetical protein ACT2CV_06685 [Pasteurellaceae bacterium 22721_9_1]
MHYKNTRFVKIIGLLIVMLLLIFSFILRKNDFNNVVGSANIEATYHTLLTVQALQKNTADHHYFLPTVSLGKERDKHIAWGATVPTEKGDYIYTSFTSPGFLAPYAIFSFFSIEPTEKNLAYLNFAIGAFVSVVLYLLLFRSLIVLGYKNSQAIGGAIIGCIISIFSKEVLQSHGVIYWVHSFYQLIFILGLYFLFLYLTASDDKKSSIYEKLLIVFVGIGALTEWTGYIFSLGLILLFWFGKALNCENRKLAIKLLITTLMAGFLTIAHYSFAVGVEPTIKAFIASFFI